MNSNRLNSLAAPARHRHSPYPMIELMDALKIVENHCKPLDTVIMNVRLSGCEIGIMIEMDSHHR